MPLSLRACSQFLFMLGGAPAAHEVSSGKFIDRGLNSSMRKGVYTWQRIPIRDLVRTVELSFQLPKHGAHYLSSSLLQLDFALQVIFGSHHLIRVSGNEPMLLM